MHEELLRQYADIRAQKASLEAIESTLRKEIFANMQKEGLDMVDRDYGRFVLSKGRPKWEYSPALDRRLENIKIAQIKEQKQGVAVEIAAEPHLTFIVPKVKTQ